MRSSRRRLYSKSYMPPHKRYARQKSFFNGFFEGLFSRIADKLSFSNKLSFPNMSKAKAIPISPDGLGDSGIPLDPSVIEPKPARAGLNPATPNIPARVLGICLLLLMLCGGMFLGWALMYSDTSITISYTDGGYTRSIRTKAENVGELMALNGFTLREGDTLNYDADEPLEEGMEISVTDAFPVAVASGGEVSVLRMQGGTVLEALSLADITYSANDELTKLPFEDVEPGMHIQHISIEIKYETKDQVINYKEQVIKDSNRYKGNDTVRVEGQDGEKRVVRRLIYHDGELYSREIMNQLILKEAVDQVKIVGTKIRYQTSLQGDEREWKAAPKSSEISKTLTASEVTAYTHTGRRTATGKWPKIGYVAVNPNVIPYGTKLYIPGYGYCTAQDTGAFRFEEGGKKNQIDVFMNTVQECKKWGRKKNVKIYILK